MKYKSMKRYFLLRSSYFDIDNFLNWQVLRECQSHDVFLLPGNVFGRSVVDSFQIV